MRASYRSIPVLIGMILLLHTTTVFATDVVCELQLLGVDAVADPLASDPGLFSRVTPLKPAPVVKGLSDRDGFFFLQPTDPRMNISASHTPKLEITNMRFVKPYAILEPGQQLTIINNSSYALSFIVELSGNKKEVKIPARQRRKVAVSGTDEGLVSCVELPYLKAFIVRSGPGYIMPLPKMGRGFSRSVFNNVTPGTYSLKIWAGKWWMTQVVNVAGTKTVLRMDIDATSEGNQIRAVENPPEEAMVDAPEEEKPEVRETPSTYIPPVIPATPEKVKVPAVPKKQKKARKAPKKKAKAAKKKAPAKPKPAAKAPEPQKEKAPAKAPEKKQVKEKKKAEPEKKAPEKKKPAKKPVEKKEKKEKKKSAPSLFKIKKVDGE